MHETCGSFWCGCLRFQKGQGRRSWGSLPASWSSNVTQKHLPAINGVRALSAAKLYPPWHLKIMICVWFCVCVCIVCIVCRITQMFADKRTASRQPSKEMCLSVWQTLQVSLLQIPSQVCLAHNLLCQMLLLRFFFFKHIQSWCGLFLLCASSIKNRWEGEKASQGTTARTTRSTNQSWRATSGNCDHQGTFWYCLWRRCQPARNIQLQPRHNREDVGWRNTEAFDNNGRYNAVCVVLCCVLFCCVFCE